MSFVKGQYETLCVIECQRQLCAQASSCRYTDPVLVLRAHFYSVVFSPNVPSNLLHCVICESGQGSPDALC